MSVRLFSACRNFIPDISPFSSSLFGPAAGVNYLDFRGLGHKHTLVKFNHQRVTATHGGETSFHAVDLERFAEPFLERIEVDANARWS